MRIIGGKLSGIRIHPPKDLPVRPTTDVAKEALFNILANKIEFDGLIALDLFSGTGNVAFELASRGAKQVQSIDQSFKCVKFINDQAEKSNLDAIQARKLDAFKFLNSTKDCFDLIFADPPYDLPSLTRIPSVVMENRVLNPKGWLVVEHPSTRQMPHHPAFVEVRKYGYSSFSFYHLDQ